MKKIICKYINSIIMESNSSSVDKYYQELSEANRVEDLAKSEISIKNEHQFNDNTHTIIHVIVKEKNYVHENRKYYYIEYTYENIADGKEYSGKRQLQTHPFFNFSEDRYQSSKDGTIVVKNKMTETMVMFLLMKEEVLQRYIGRADPVQYKMNIIRSIDNFWD